jgi:hypothetical protein
MNPIFLLIAGLLVGIALCILSWFIWKRYQAPGDKVIPEVDQISAEQSLQRGDESLQRRLDELTILHAIATAGTEATDEDVLIERATQIIGESFFPNNFGVLLVDGDRLRTHPSYRELDSLKGPEWIPIGEGISGQVALLGEPMRVADVHHEQNYLEVDSATRSELCVPTFTVTFVKTFHQRLSISRECITVGENFANSSRL